VQFRFDVDTSSLTKKLDAYEQQVEALKQAMPAELADWQVEDMGRKYPDTEVADDSTAYTMIYPRSRLPSKWKRPLQRLVGQMRARRGTKVYRPHLPRVPSTRPILRPELFDKLCERMNALLDKAMQWR
jgi:hypothetical protein